MAATNPLLTAIAFGYGKTEPKPQLCVVHDDAAVRISLKFVFGANGFDVRGFATGDELLNWRALSEAEGFVLDHKPRGTDGIELGRRLRARGNRAPIVLTTGFRCAALETAVGSGDFLLATPGVDEELIGRLSAIIDARRHMRLRKTT
jgi:FixJ family two-component response regulator